MTIDPRIHEIARRELTAKQFEAWERQVLHGRSTRQIADDLWIHRSTVQARLDAAWLNLARHGIMSTLDRRPYLAEQEPA